MLQLLYLRRARVLAEPVPPHSGTTLNVPPAPTKPDVRLHRVDGPFDTNDFWICGIRPEL